MNNIIKDGIYEKIHISNKASCLSGQGSVAV